MYTYNLYCFGHKTSVNKDLNNFLMEIDGAFKKRINNKLWEINFPYHGSQIAGDCFSCVFGTVITDDDNNSEYINEIKNANELDYIEYYNEFLSFVILELEKDLILEDDLEFKHFVNLLKKFTTENKPCFYTVETSS